MSDAKKKIINTQTFYGGKSTDRSIGPTASFAYSQALEFRKNPSKLTVLPGPRKISAGVVQDLILNIVQVPNGSRYGYGDQGYVYKIDTSNVVTYVDKLSEGTDGLLYRADTDALYFVTPTEVKRYYPMTGTPTFDATYGKSKSIDTNAYQTGNTNIYQLTTSIKETQVEYRAFQPDIEPFYSIKVNILNKGTGDWTLTLHDGLNNVLGTVTKTNAELGAGLTEFVFSSPVRGLVKPNARTYHFHLTSTVADGTVSTVTNDRLDLADFELWAYRLVDTVNGFHPTAQFQQFICIGNERYLAVWEPLTDRDPPNNEFQRHRLVFPPGYEVCGVAPTDEFLVIACEKKSTNSTKDFQEGKLFIWDGTAQTYNQVVDVSGGSPQGLYSQDNFPYFIVNGWLYAWPGGKNIIKVRKIADVDIEYSDEVEDTTVYPNMMTTRDNILHFGYPSVTTNQSIEHGVYTWGSVDKNYSSSFGYSYLISTQTNLQTTANSLKLGCVRNFGDEMYISWKDENNFGLDIVDGDCNPAPTFKFRARSFDAGAIYRNKLADKMAITTSTLPSGVEITPKYSVNGAAEVSGSSLTSGAQVVTDIRQGLFKDVYYGFDGTCSGDTTPEILSVALKWDPLVDQEPF